MYDVIVMLSHGINNLLRTMKRPYWPVAERIKLSIPVSVSYIEQFENVAATHAREHGYDGVVCGHIHRANLKHIEGTRYCNTGDWVESCSALVEKTNGELELLRWPHGAQVAGRPSAELLPDAA